jgi:hypothetical protein
MNAAGYCQGQTKGRPGRFHLTNIGERLGAIYTSRMVFSVSVCIVTVRIAVGIDFHQGILKLWLSHGRDEKVEDEEREERWEGYGAQMEDEAARVAQTEERQESEQEPDRRRQIRSDR